MKGVIFVELLRMAEANAGEGLVDEVLDSLTLESGGAYSAIGSYSCGELFSIVGAFSERLDAPAEDLQKMFGHWMFSYFVENYGEFFTDKKSAFDMLASIENEVHVEVRKLYPDAELPSFETLQTSETEMSMTYKSARPLQSFCHGLIEACLTHYGTPGVISVDDRSDGHPAHVVFLIGLEKA